MRDDGFDRFNWDAWAEDDASEDSGALDGANGASANGHRAARDSGEPGGEPGAAPDHAPAAGWVSAGGVLHWEEPDEQAEDPRAEADSPLAADDLALPEGAPDAPRVRAVHAWIMRQRAREQDTLGSLLLARREQRTSDEEEPPARRPRRNHPTPAADPVDLAIAEHEAATDEYDALLAALEDHAAHAGPGRVLIEYYLWLSEHLAALAAAPEAAAGDAAPTTPGTARWRGRALAALAVRGRVERVSAPATDD